MRGPGAGAAVRAKRKWRVGARAAGARALQKKGSLQPTTPSRMSRDPAKRRASNQRYNQSDKGRAAKQREAARHFKSGLLAQRGTFKGVAQRGAHRVGAGEGAAVKVGVGSAQTRRGCASRGHAALPSAHSPIGPAHAHQQRYSSTDAAPCGSLPPCLEGAEEQGLERSRCIALYRPFRVPQHLGGVAS
jgi:hypothetical protein